MIVYQLAKAKYSRKLSGKGAEKTGGRWNSKGIPMIYTSDSRALCTTEIAVHMPLGLLPSDYKIISIDIPDSINIIILPEKKFPIDWNSILYSGGTQKIGNGFIKQNESAILKVPSAVIPDDFNYLLNPNHKDFQKIVILRIEPFVFDSRLFIK